MIILENRNNLNKKNEKLKIINNDKFNRIFLKKYIYKE